MLTQSEFFIASVHHSIRWPETEPPARGGHLVLVTALNSGVIRFHNPSGHEAATRENVELPLETFDRFFAGRGIAIDADDRKVNGDPAVDRSHASACR
ncbi:hypothetical protein PY650_18710 [Rhizobium calliandrae]|uniref:Peptidase C39-like domain-containing protein n=1 Tax=Rhizobium calliandrae TaxID=1312182 RepID=A0ABT7KGB0_9HYPH|nr:hypothetical protein [Rhizobium calliandrae]MDL2407655.1 hypothetical protein [Rhizobium calliandrae]